jgi:hypothetical protein
VERLLLSIVIAALAALAYLLLAHYHRRRVSAEARVAPGRPRLLYFHSLGCSACAAQSRYLDALDSDSQALVTTIDVEYDPQAARRYNVLTLPTTIVVDRMGSVQYINYGLASTARLNKQLGRMRAI